MAMSLNSLDSKTSPHSRHSQDSVSSSRLTICTRGCLHWFMILLCLGSCDGGWLHNSGWQLRRRLDCPILPEILGILDPPGWKSSHSSVIPGAFYFCRNWLLP